MDIEKILLRPQGLTEYEVLSGVQDNVEFINKTLGCVLTCYLMFINLFNTLKGYR